MLPDLTGRKEGKNMMIAAVLAFLAGLGYLFCLLRRLDRVLDETTEKKDSGSGGKPENPVV